ncbi:MAG: aminoglycoside 6'-N-acetyltransferase [Bacilli bacterium]
MSCKKLFTNTPIDKLRNELIQDLVKKDIAIFVCYLKNEIIAFAQCQLRYDYVEGTNSSPVGYLEGIYVEPMYRKQGIAKKLLEECEKWSLKKGCTEFASDCELNNSISFNFHLSVGFEEANRIICFRKKL